MPRLFQAYGARAKQYGSRQLFFSAVRTVDPSLVSTWKFGVTVTICLAALYSTYCEWGDLDFSQIVVPMTSAHFNARGDILVAAVLDYSTVPAFLVAARSISERTNSVGIRFAVQAGDMAWKEVQAACPCYLKEHSCRRILRTSGNGESGEESAMGSRRSLSEMPPRWSDPTEAYRLQAQLASLASCAARLVPESTVIVLPDPHFLALGDVSGLVMQAQHSPESWIVMRAGSLALTDPADTDKAGGGLRAADADVLIVDTDGWRTSQGPQLACPLENRTNSTDIIAAVEKLNQTGTTRLPQGVASWQDKGELNAWAGFATPGCDADSPKPASTTKDSLQLQPVPVLLRLIGAAKPWEGHPPPRKSTGAVWQPSSIRGTQNAGKCSIHRLGVKEEAQRLIECRYSPRPGLPSADLERHQYVWYYRYFRNWFQPGPSRPALLPDGSMQGVRDPPRPDGNRFSDLMLRIRSYDETYNWAPFVDKAAVKHHARLVLGDGYTIDTLGVVTVESAPYFRPPVAGLTDFAFKASNLAGMNALVQDSKMIVCQGSFAVGAERLGMGYCQGRKLKGDLFDYVVQDVSRRFKNPGREMQSRMRRSLIMEKLYSGHNIPADYEFYCSKGNVMVILETVGRFDKVGMRRGYYLADWTWLPDVFRQQAFKPAVSPGPRPAMLDEMVRVAQMLSKPFPFVRIDLFQLRGKVYLGEMGFTPTSALQLIEPPLVEQIMGRIVGHHLPLGYGRSSSIWATGIGKEGKVLSQRAVVEAMLSLSE